MSATVKERGSIVEKTVLLRVNFRVMGNSRKVSTGILHNSDTTTASKVLKIQKILLDSKELAAITKADNAMRQELYALCLPYDMGLALLPRVSIDSTYARFEAYASERKTLVQAFIDAYPTLRADARERCEKLAEELSVPFDYLYNSNDYPDVSLIAAKFSFDWDFLSLSVPDELKYTGKFEEATNALEAKVAAVSDEITVIMRQTLLDLVSHLQSSLEPSADGKPKRLFSSAVTNIQEFLETFKARNITDDAELDALVEKTKAILHPGVNADMLKKDDQFKATISASMGEITGELSKLVEVVPGRKFRKPSPVSPVPVEEPTPTAV